MPSLQALSLSYMPSVLSTDLWSEVHPISLNVQALSLRYKPPVLSTGSWSEAQAISLNVQALSSEVHAMSFKYRLTVRGTCHEF